jgi:hypothetical protein
VSGAVQVGQRRQVGDVAGVQLDGGVPGGGPRLGVAPRPGQRGVVVVGGVHRGVGPRVGQRQRQRPRAGAQVHHHRGGDARQRGQTPGEHQLGLGARHEHPGPDGQRDRAHGGRARDVLQRHPGGAAVHQPVQLLDHRRVHQRDQRQPGPFGAQDVRGQQLGVRPRARHARGGQRSLGREHGQPQRLTGHGVHLGMICRPVRRGTRDGCS